MDRRASGRRRLFVSFTLAGALAIVAGLPGVDANAATKTTKKKATKTTAKRYPKAEMSKVIFSGVTPNAGNWTVQWGVAKGLFAKNGIPVDMIYSANSPAVMAALLSGSIQFSSTVYDSAIVAHKKDPNVIFIADGYRGLPFDLVVGKDINTVADLKGKKCGAANPIGIGDALYVEAMVEAASGLKQGTDYDIVNVNVNGATALAALQSGAVSCIASQPPQSGLLANQGLKTLYNLEKVPTFQNLSFFGINTLRTTAEGNPNTIQAFLRGYLESIAQLYDPANKAEAIALLAKNANLPVESATSAYDWVIRGGYPRDGVIASDIVPRWIANAKRTGTLTAKDPDFLDDLVENSYVQKAYASLPDSVKKGPGPSGLLAAGKKPA